MAEAVQGGKQEAGDNQVSPCDQGGGQQALEAATDKPTGRRVSGEQQEGRVREEEGHALAAAVECHVEGAAAEAAEEAAVAGGLPFKRGPFDTQLARLVLRVEEVMDQMGVPTLR